MISSRGDMSDPIVSQPHATEDDEDGAQNSANLTHPLRLRDFSLIVMHWKYGRSSPVQSLRSTAHSTGSRSFVMR
jgi:hypothetical protein